jgi:hypothetical protein
LLVTIKIRGGELLVLKAPNGNMLSRSPLGFARGRHWFLFSTSDVSVTDAHGEPAYVLIARDGGRQCGLLGRAAITTEPERNRHI